VGMVVANFNTVIFGHPGSDLSQKIAYSFGGFPQSITAVAAITSPFILAASSMDVAALTTRIMSPLFSPKKALPSAFIF
jgi:hypothetical protein